MLPAGYQRGKQELASHAVVRVINSSGIFRRLAP